MAEFAECSNNRVCLQVWELSRSSIDRPCMRMVESSKSSMCEIWLRKSEPSNTFMDKIKPKCLHPIRNIWRKILFQISFGHYDDPYIFLQPESVLSLVGLVNCFSFCLLSTNASDSFSWCCCFFCRDVWDLICNLKYTLSVQIFFWISFEWSVTVLIFQKYRNFWILQVTLLSFLSL